MEHSIAAHFHIYMWNRSWDFKKWHNLSTRTNIPWTSSFQTLKHSQDSLCCLNKYMIFNQVAWEIRRCGRGGSNNNYIITFLCCAFLIVLENVLALGEHPSKYPEFYFWNIWFVHHISIRILAVKGVFPFMPPLPSFPKFHCASSTEQTHHCHVVACHGLKDLLLPKGCPVLRLLIKCPSRKAAGEEIGFCMHLKKWRLHSQN